MKPPIYTQNGLKVYRYKKHIATFVDGEIECEDALYRKYILPIKKCLHNGTLNANSDEPEVTEEEAPPTKAENTGSHGYTKAELRRMLAESDDEEVVDYAQLAKDLGLTPAPNPTPQPAFTPEGGQKTEAYVDWLLKYHPVKFLSTFRVKGKGMVVTYDNQNNPNGEKEMFLAESKTHLTAVTKSN